MAAADIQQPPIATRVGTNVQLLIKNAALGRTFFIQYSSNLVDWHYLPWMDIGAGNDICACVNASGTARNYYRLQYSDVVGSDFDGDGLTNYNEIYVYHTAPFNPDTDGDTIGDGAETNAGLNPTQPDDARPGIYVLAWQRLEDAQVDPVGWSSEIRDSSNHPTAPLPNAYRKLDASAVEHAFSNVAGHEFNRAKSMTVQRTLLPPADFPARVPTYRESVVYTHSTGLPFVSIGAHKNPTSWGYTAQGPIASRNQYPGTNSPNYDYTWKYASSGGNTLTGEHHSSQVQLPVDTMGTLLTWVDAPVTQGGYRFTSGSATIILPNASWPPYGDIFGEPGPNGTQNWTSATVCKTEESSGVKTTWTLGNRWTYSDLRAEMETLRPNINVIEERSGPGINWPVNPIYYQSAAGLIIQGSYQFRFERQPGGGMGPTALLWPETFTPLDNPDTPGVNEAGPPQTRLRVVILPPNAPQSPIYTLDHRIAPFTVLPDSATAPKADGDTEVGGLDFPKVITDYNRDGRLNDSDTRPADFEPQGAYEQDGTFRAQGAIVWANLDYDEERVITGKPVPDSIRFWHNGLNFEATDEDFVISNGERSFASLLAGYQAPAEEKIYSPCPDIAPILLPRLEGLPADYQILLRAARPEDLKAFHLYKRIPDFDKGDSGENAIWGAFNANAPWIGGSEVIDTRTINLTKWLVENAPNYVGFSSTRRKASDPFVFGVEAMLYKGMKYGFQDGTGGSTFDGNLDFTLLLRSPQGKTCELDRFRLTLLRLPAFPGAQGFGEWSQGGRGGEVYKVTNLHDSGVGSLRAGIENRVALPGAAFPGTERKIPRTIVFEVGGRIALAQSADGKLSISRGQITVAWQTASGQGITLTDASFQVSGLEKAPGSTKDAPLPVPPKMINRPNDTILRYIRIRRATAVPSGKNPNSSTDYPMGPDAFTIKSASRVIVDHCSFSGGIDGTMDIILANSAINEQPEMDVTAQWCFVHHTLNPHSKASLLRGKFGARYSVLGCFYGHNEMRNPEIGWLANALPQNDSQRMTTEFSDCVIYNWRDRFCGVTQEVSGGISSNLRLQFLANHYKPGNDTADPITVFQIQSTGDKLYFKNNRLRGSAWASDYEYVGNHGAAAKTASPFVTDFTSLGNANTARDKIVTHGGSSRSRDAADLAYVVEIAAGAQTPKYSVTGTIPTALQPAYLSSGTVAGYTDSDSDGMDDGWESAHAGTGGATVFLPWQDADGDGWTNLEEYLNKTNPNAANDPMAALESNIDGNLF